jgi:hypothetical protein
MPMPLPSTVWEDFTAIIFMPIRAWDFTSKQTKGLVGACECDIPSTATMLTFTTLTQGRPGYISRFPLSTLRSVKSFMLIALHPIMLFGAEGPANPFDIMTHSEDRQGASGEVAFADGVSDDHLENRQYAKEIIFHQAKACR